MGHVKVVQSGNFLEVYEYENEVSKNVGLARKRSRRAGYKRYVYVRPDNVRRKAKEFARLVRSNLVGVEPPSLLTLTMYEIVSVERSYELLTIFIKRLRRDTGSDWKYIAVPEFQKRGAVHFHVIVWGLNNILQNERNTRYIQRLWQYGTCDSILTDGNPKIAGYLSKYMSKAMFDKRLRGQKGYTASRNVLRSLSVSFKSAISPENTKLIWGLDIENEKPIIEKEYTVEWLGKGRYRLFNLEKK